MDTKTACSSCHPPASGFTNLATAMLADGGAIGKDPSFSRDEPQQFRTPSLRFVGGTAPYFHDGRAATLTDLIANNQDRMGWTSHLDDAERGALVAYLETL